MAARTSSRGLGALNVDIETAIAASRVEVIAQGQQQARLAHLPRRVQHEVFFLGDQGQNLMQVHPAERGQAIMIRAVDRPGGVEETHSRTSDPCSEKA
ncbi:hypothetical protein [Candidatus Amarolinea dominans]|uniref:hypothetical protein n=1 Tax=Candidatus Amarolinea dominans TaxID=3140696 RepID=UPI0031CC782C